MRYAFKEIVINPRQPVRQAGFIQQVSPVEKVHDDLKARILVLDDNNSIFVHISCDSLGINISFQRELTALVRHCFDKPFKLILSATHTHFAGDSADRTYYHQMLDQISEAIQTLSYHEAGEITVSYDHINADGLVGTSRISHHQANVVLGLIQIFADNEKIGDIIYHNCHPTIMSGADTHFFSAEYPGYVIRKCQENHPDLFFTYMQGASGDISSRFVRDDQTYDSVIRLASKLQARIQDIENRDPVRYPLVLNFDEIVISCEHEFTEINFDEIPACATERELETIGYGQLMRQKLKENPEKLQKESVISKVSLGALTFVFAPNELFSGYIDYVDLNRAVLVCYSNGYSPYVTPIDKKLLTYETFTDTLTKETKQKIADAIYQLSH